MRRRVLVKELQVAYRVTALINESWSMGFVSDRLVGGERFRLLTLVDNFSRESLAIEVGQWLTGADIVNA